MSALAGISFIICVYFLTLAVIGFFTISKRAEKNFMYALIFFTLTVAFLGNRY